MPDSLKSSTRELREVETRPDSAQPTRGVFSTADSTAQDAAHLQQDEANMRRALGMLGGATRTQPSGPVERRAPSFNNGGHGGGHSGGPATRRHRFVQDGDVPVTVVRPRGDHAADPLRPPNTSPVNRLDALQESLAAESSARASAERALEEAQSFIRTLQTKLSHLELARDEAVALAHSRAEEVAALSAEVASAAVLAEPAPSTPEPVTKAKPAAAFAETVESPEAPRVARGRRPKLVEVGPEPEPVKWWITSQVTKTPATRRARPRSIVAPTSE